MLKYLGGLAILVAVLALTGCSSRGTAQCSGVTPAPEDLEAFKSSLKLTVEADPTLGPAQAEGFELRTEPGGDGCRVQVIARAAVRMRSFYCSLSYDDNKLRPASTEPGPALGPEGRVLSLAASDPGLLHFGAVMVHPQDQPGFSGDGVLAEIRFGLKGGLPLVSRGTSAVPDSNASSCHIAWDQGTATLSWYYANRGDYDQNGMVNLSDLTPLGIHFGKHGPFAHNLALSVVDGDDNGEINLADITPISIGFQNDCLGGYAVYATQLVSNYPQSNTEPPSIGALGGMIWSGAAGNPTQDRLAFQFIVSAPLPNAYYWVRPFSSLGEFGTPSPMVGGSAAEMPVIGITNPPPGGSGTLADPYLFDCDTAYIFTLTSMSMGDLTTDPGTTYFVDKLQPGVIPNTDATLPPTYPFYGILEIWGVNDSMRSLNTIYASVAPYYSWDITLVDDGGAGGNDVGRNCDTINLNQNPAISYYDATDKDLKFARWSPAPWPMPGTWQVMTVDAAGDVGDYCSSINFNGTAMIAYYDETQHQLKCAVAKVPLPNVAADWATHSIEGSIEVSGCSMAVVGALPAIAYSDLGHNHLHYARALNATPSTAADWYFFEMDAWGTATDPSLHSVNGVPCIAYIAFADHFLEYARCIGAFPATAADWVTMEVDAASNVGGVSLSDIEGLQPVLAYNDFNTYTIKYATGYVDTEPGDPWTIVIADGNGQPGSYLSLAPVAGRFCLAYTELLDNRLHFARTNWPYPEESNWQRTVADSTNYASGFCSIGAFGPFNAEWPGIAYRDGDADLRFVFGWR